MSKFELPLLDEAIARLDDLFATGFKSDDPPMKDWVAVRFALKAAQNTNEGVAAQTNNSRYMALVRDWSLSARSSANSDEERAVYERCACMLHQLNAGK